MLKTFVQPTLNCLRTLSGLTQHIKPIPTNLSLESVEGKNQDARVMEFYERTLLQDDPLVRAAKLQDSLELQNFVKESLRNQVTTFLSDKGSSAVVAAASGGPITHITVPDIHLYMERNMKDEQSRRLVHLWSAMITEANLLERLSLPSLWDVSYIATAKHMRGLGLGRFLLSHQRRVARKLGYGAISVGSSHFYLSKALQKLGYKSLPPVPLNSYKDAEGHPWLNTSLPPPHLHLQVFYSRLHSRRFFDTLLE